MMRQIEISHNLIPGRLFLTYLESALACDDSVFEINRKHDVLGGSGDKGEDLIS